MVGSLKIGQIRKSMTSIAFGFNFDGRQVVLRVQSVDGAE